MVKLIDSLLHSSTLSRVISSTAKRKKSIGTFDVGDELGEGASTEKTASAPVQNPQKIQGLSVLSLSNIKNVPEHEIISYGDGLLDQLTDTMPVVSVKSRPKGLPMANTFAGGFCSDHQWQFAGCPAP